MKRDVAALTQATFDLLVLGGGITGAGVALDAVTRGLRVALIDKGDFAAGTSSASSKLIHGVHEALSERRRLLHNAPHLVRPLRFVIPIRSGSRVPPWKWRLGLTVYDALAGRDNLHRSRPLSQADLRRQFPGLRSAGLVAGASYYDAQMDDARLCIEVLKTASVRGAVLANYVEASDFTVADGSIRGVRAVDRVTGAVFSIAARQVLNATGPWVDTICRLAGDESGPHLQPTKGVHLLTPDRGLTTAFLLLHPADGRVLFVIPWLGKTLIGTTDTMEASGPDDLTVRDDEVQYLLDAHNYYFEPPLHPQDVLGSFAGLRPLIRARPGEPSSRSREFRVFASANGLLSVAGGKYTTYRHMAEVVTDEAVRRLGLRRPCVTHELPLDGTPDEPWREFAARAVAELLQRFPLDESAARHLVERYGRRAPDVAAYTQDAPQLARPIVAGEPDLHAEFAYQRDQEMAMRPEDCWLRRTRLGLAYPELIPSPPSILKLRRA